MFQNKYPWGKVGFAFLFGGLVGAAAALLYAPMKGNKLQKKLGKVVDEQVDNVEKIMKKVVNA